MISLAIERRDEDSVKSLPAVFSGCLVGLAVAAVFLLCEAARQRSEWGENLAFSHCFHRLFRVLFLDAKGGIYYNITVKIKSCCD